MRTWTWCCNQSPNSISSRNRPLQKDIADPNCGQALRRETLPHSLGRKWIVPNQGTNFQIQPKRHRSKIPCTRRGSSGNVSRSTMRDRRTSRPRGSWTCRQVDVHRSCTICSLLPSRRIDVVRSSCQAILDIREKLVRSDEGINARG